MPGVPGAPGPAEGTVLLRAEGVSVAFDAFRAVDGVGLTLRAGDLLGLIGPNGAGKTTLLRALCGLQRMAAGRVSILDNPVGGRNRDFSRHVGFTPDTPPMYENMTVAAFMEFVARGYGIHPSLWDERIMFWLEKVWLKEKLMHKIRSLSRGMKQRLGIARTLLANPAVILLDEPAAGLDPAGRVQFRELLMSLRQQGKALIVSSHILADMGEYCSHIGIMSAGRMVKLGTVHEIAHGMETTRRRYTVLLARAFTDTREVLDGIEGVTNVSVNEAGDRVELDYESDKTAAAELLAALVGAGLPVAGFSMNAVDLEQVYLRTGIRQVD